MPQLTIGRPPLRAPRDVFEGDAAAWEREGRPAPDAEPMYGAVLYLWVWPRKSDVSGRLREFQAAVQAALDANVPGWYDALMDQRTSCVACSREYRIMKLALCATCGAAWCSADEGTGGRSPEGGKRCDACEVGELVG